jgi:hypothetical protein
MQDVELGLQQGRQDAKKFALSLNRHPMRCQKFLPLIVGIVLLSRPQCPSIGDQFNTADGERPFDLKVSHNLVYRQGVCNSTMLKLILAFVPFSWFVVASSIAGEASDFNPLQNLRPEHPRILVLDDQLNPVKAMIKADPSAEALYQHLQAEARKLLSKPPKTYVIGGPENTLLDVSREVEGRVWLLAGLYRLNGDRRLAARARDEMLAAAAFPDWYPKHFLDTAEMTAALGVGYDWLFDFLTPAERQTIRQAIVDKGLKPGIAGLAPGGRLAKLHNNWVQVCNSGLTLGALAIADEESNTAAQVVSLSRVHMANIMKLFAPDGGFEEGPGYWNYATAYNVYYLAALESALGMDFGLANAKGFADTGNYRMQTTGPLGKGANFGDAGEQVGSAPQMLWLARKFSHPAYAMHERDLTSLLLANPKLLDASRFAIMELLWDQPDEGKLTEAGFPTAAKFDRVAIACMRSDWGDTNAVYIAFKGGDNHASHGHLDLGTFVLDAFGQRWAMDLGPDSYGLPGYFGSQRWSYYRMRTEGHNTLTIGNQNQEIKAAVPLTAFHEGANRSFAIADLREAYPSQLAGWQRGLMLLNRREVLVQDEVTPRQAADIVWNFHTGAAITVAGDGKNATLSQGVSQIRLQILSPENARFKDEPVSVSPPQRPAPGIRNLSIQLPNTAAPTTIAVLMSSPEDKSSVPALIPLNQWQMRLNQK